MSLEILPDPDAVAAAAVARVRSAAEEAIEWRGGFRWVVPGGRTPVPIFDQLAADADFPWDRTEIGFADERAVPPDRPDSNYRVLAEHLLKPLGARAPKVERMPGEWPDLREAAHASAAWFREPADLVLLGIGEDGHIASLFPRSDVLAERSLRVVAVYNSPKPPPRRLTITPRVLLEARTTLVVAMGSGKALAVAAALAEAGSVPECPARLVRTGEWIVERSSATAIR